MALFNFVANNSGSLTTTWILEDVLANSPAVEDTLILRSLHHYVLCADILIWNIVAKAVRLQMTPDLEQTLGSARFMSSTYNTIFRSLPLGFMDIDLLLCRTYRLASLYKWNPRGRRSFLQVEVVDYNYKEMAALAAQYEEVVNGNKTLFRSNAVAKAAVSSDIIPFCVGYASNPVRIRIFKNKLTCAIQGWVTLHTFTAHTKKDDYLASKPICVGHAENPTRSMFFSNKNSCTEGGWKTDYSFYESTNLRTFKGEYASHLEVHKKLSITSIPDAKTLRCVSLMIDRIQNRFVTVNPSSTPGTSLPEYAADAYNAKCSDLVVKSTIEVSRVQVAGYASLEVQINKKTYAAISLRVNTDAYFYLYRHALLESLRSGQPVIVTKNDKFDTETSVTAYFQGAAFAFGRDEFWNAKI
ncbi:hypothetical protein BGZ95_007233 [Linnemannia exigua]|uniref:Uncharacterized protein n=1 Tax=Linnemannia exigua TaxID=604196 RepID=A0AAD4DMN4_9FUNG|nr:hypothetical protein BGZ95_007233 [Linnemannia exigua]